MPSEDEFYVGYQKQAPIKIGRWMRFMVLFLIIQGIGFSVVIASLQPEVAPSNFEFLEYREFQGIVLNDPYPRLLVERPGGNEGHTTFSSYLLVAPFKFGADKLIAPFIGQRVVLEGELIYRDDKTMIQVKPDTIEAFKPVDALTAVRDATSGPSKNLGSVTLKGEIIDSKCFLGVMKPGHLNHHEGCAVRCISGGIPPMLVVNARAQKTHYFLLVNEVGEPVNKDVLGDLAVPVEITGELIEYGDLSVLKAEPKTYKLL